uniref:ShKT domain-containing protein n=1 Tax=Ditylenchus dipsaci TaxID=166011 RepID=A0A915CRK1_9BILA
MIFSTSFIFVALLFATCVSGDEVLVTDKVVADRLPEYCFEKYSSTTSGSNLLHKEQPCEDDLPKTISDPNVCASLFQKTGTPADQTKTDALCINPNYQQEILWCAKTCKLCCLRSEYSCSDRPPAADPDQCVNLKKTMNVKRSRRKLNFAYDLVGNVRLRKIIAKTDTLVVSI